MKYERSATTINERRKRSAIALEEQQVREAEQSRRNQDRYNTIADKIAEVANDDLREILEYLLEQKL